MKRKLTLLLAMAIALSACSMRRKSSSTTEESISQSETNSSSSSGKTSSSSTATSSSSSSQKIDNEIILKIAYAADKYHLTTPEELANKAGIENSKSITYIDMFRLIRCAFENLMPSIKGVRGYQGDFSSHSVSRTLTNQEKVDYRFLSGYGLIAEDINPDQKVTDKDLNLYIQRVHSYIGTSIVDDYAAAMNRDFLFENDKYDGASGEDLVHDSVLINSDVLYENAFDLLIEAAKDPSYSELQHLVDIYESGESYIELKTYEPVQTAISDLSNASSSDVFFNVITNQFSETAVSPLLSFDTDKLGAFYGGHGYYFNKGYRVDTSGILSMLLDDYRCNFKKFSTDKKKAFDISISTYIQSFGVSSEVANIITEGFYVFLEYLATSLSSYCYSNWDESMTLVTKDNDPLSAGSNGQYTIYSMFDEAGLNTPAIPMSNMDYYTLYYIGKMLINNAMFNYVKAYVLYNYLSIYTIFRDKIRTDFNKSLFVIMSSYNVLSYYQTTERYEENVRITESLFNDIIATLKSNAVSNRWLSSSGIDALNEKANTVRHSLYGEYDGTNSVYSNSISNGFTNDMIYNYTLYNNNIAHLWSDWSKGTYDGTISFGEELELVMEPFTPNAYYYPFTNSIYITMGYLFSKGDNLSEYTTEDMLATFGVVMGHEITHGFDSNGCYYDKNGNYVSNSIFPSQDLKKYQSKQQEVIELYNYEVMPGINQSGEITLSEDLADIGGMGIVLGIAEKQNNFKYPYFYEKFARNFMSKCSRRAYIETYQNDVHAYGPGRLNPLLKSRAKFFDTYDIQPWDMMYRDPNKEIIIW